MRTISKLWLIPAILLVWELSTRAMDDLDFPPPLVIVTKMWELWFSGPVEHLFLTDGAIENILPSLSRMLGAWALASVIGVLAGVAIGRSRTGADYVDPLIQLGRAIPPPLLLPLFSVLFVVDLQMKLATIVFGVIWPVLLNTIEGTRSVNRVYLETATVFGLSRAARLRRIIIPAAAPKILAGLRLSLSLALILMVISELVGTDGIGYQLLLAQRTFDTAAVWATIALLGLLGYLANVVFVLAERRLLVWHRHATHRS